MLLKLVFVLCFVNNLMGNSDPSYGSKQIITLLNEYFNESESLPLLRGHHFYKNKDEMIFQLEIETDVEKIDNSLMLSFNIISQLAHVSKIKFTHSVLIIHFEINAVPIIAKSEIECSKKYFINRIQNEDQWRKNCLYIRNN